MTGVLVEEQLSRATIEELREALETLLPHAQQVEDDAEEYLFAVGAGDGRAEVMYRIRVEDNAGRLRELLQEALDALP